LVNILDKTIIVKRDKEREGAVLAGLEELARRAAAIQDSPARSTAASVCLEYRSKYWCAIIEGGILHLSQ
jgi:hypothetical protein